jgi:hypothetical protein
MSQDDGLGATAGFDIDETNEGDLEEFVPEPLGDDDDERVPDADPYAWTAGDPELREYAEKKGLRDPVTALKSYREAESRMRQLEADNLREREMRELAEQQAIREQDTRAQSTAPAGDDPDTVLEQTMVMIEQAYESGEINAAQRGQAVAHATRQYNQAYREQIRTEVLSQVDERYAPVADHVTYGEMEKASTEMLGKYGREIGERAIQIYQDRRMPNNAQGIRDAYAIAAGEQYAERRQAQQRATAAETLDGGGRTAARRGPSAADIMRDRIMRAGVRPNDGL